MIVLCIDMGTRYHTQQIFRFEMPDVAMFFPFGICLWEIYCCDMPYPDLSFADVSSAVVRQVS